MAQVVSVNISEKKGMRKHPVPYIDVRLRHGIVGDAHAGDWHRQISLLAVESVDAMRADCPVPLDSGVFAAGIPPPVLQVVSKCALTGEKRGSPRFPGDLPFVSQSCFSSCRERYPFSSDNSTD